MRLTEFWAETRYADASFVTDGTILLLREACDEHELDRIGKAILWPAPPSPYAIQDLWEQTLKEATRPMRWSADGMVFPGDRQGAIPASRLAFIYHGKNQDGILVDTRKLEWLTLAMAIDEIRGRDPNMAVALYAGGDPVAILMPLRSDLVWIPNTHESGPSPLRG